MMLLDSQCIGLVKHGVNVQMKPVSYARMRTAKACAAIKRIEYGDTYSYATDKAKQRAIDKYNQIIHTFQKFYRY